MPDDNQTVIPDAEASQQSGQVDKAGKASNLAAELLLNIIELATYIPENEEEFDDNTFAPLALRDPSGDSLRLYSAVNRWWRAVICGIQPRDIKCYCIQQVENALQRLIASNTRSIDTFLWYFPGIPYSKYPNLSDKAEDSSTVDTRTNLFERFMQYLSGSIKVLILSGQNLIEPTLDVTNYGGWQKVTSFCYNNASLPNCGLLITSLLRQFLNLESLHLAHINEQYYMFSPPPRPTYSLKVFSVWWVDDLDFVEWTGGNSRATLEELFWSVHDERSDPREPSRFKEDLSDVFPGDTPLSLRRLRVSSRYVPLLDHCDETALRWLNIEFELAKHCDPWPDAYYQSITYLSDFSGLQRLWMTADYGLLDEIPSKLEAGDWPSLVFFHVHTWAVTSEDVVDEIESVCEKRNIVFTNLNW